MQQNVKVGVIVQLMFLLPSVSLAQNLEEISLKKGPQLTGSLNVNTVGYKAFGLPQRRDPFNWFVTGGLNLNLFGYSAPFTFSVSNANKSYSQPFNQFHFAPQYKWIKTYTGFTSMTFSPYTLSGHMFFGGGVELTPGKWRIAAMYGRLKKAVPFDLTDTLQFTKAAFKRMGYGIKVGYETNGDAVSFNIFAAKDDVRSIPFVLPQNKITPQQNVAMSLAFRKQLFTKFSIDLEYALSALNTNMGANTEGDTVTTKPTHNLIQGLLPENSTSRYFDAVNAALGYQGKTYTVQLKYERVAPEYQTLGAYYFNNDLRNITVVSNIRLLKNKIVLGTNIGVQENNLDKSRTATMRRTVSAVNLQFTPDEKWNVSGSYSNFLSYTNVRSQSDPFYSNNLDTLDFYQVSETMNGTVARTLGREDAPQSIMLNVSYQRASSKAGSETGARQLSDFLSTTASYSYSLKPSDLTLSIGANVYNNNAAGTSTTFFGPSVSTTKLLLNKALRGSYTTSYNNTTGNGTATSPVWNNQISFSYSPPKKENARGSSNISFGLNMLKRLKAIGEQPAFTEITGTLNYSYSF